MTIDTHPQPSEYAPAFQGYISRAPEDDLLTAMAELPPLLRSMAASLATEQEVHAYAEGKWTVREVLGHLADCERVFGYRALSVARGETVSLPGFDENLYAANAPWARVPLTEIVEELAFLRESHVRFFRTLSAEAWTRVGNANGKPISVRALARVIVGHPRHHLAVLAERYGVSAG